MKCHNACYRLVLPIVLLAQVACSTRGQIQPVPEFARDVVGRPLDWYKAVASRPESYASRIGWQEKTYKLEGGNFVYVAPVKPNCTIFWEVDKTETIVGYKLEGTRCD